MGEDEQTLRNQIGRWQDRGLLLKLRRGLYLLNKSDRQISPSRLFVANQLYSPSYVSLEYALGVYGLIPERVLDVTSVTTRKTQAFHNEVGHFIYRHIKKECFSGFKLVKDEAGLPYFIAEPEKAVVDFLYFNRTRFGQDAPQVFKEGFRFQNVSTLKRGKVLAFAAFFKNRKLSVMCKQFCDFVREVKSD